MTQLPNDPKLQPENRGIKRIVPFGALMQEDTSIQTEKPSLYLYLAGLGVTLSAIYAVTLSIDRTAFIVLIMALSVLGYATSFFMRLRGISVKTIQIPALIAIALLLLLGWTGENGLGWLFPIDDMADRGKILQIAFAWFAVLHSFTIAADSGLLFQCVPSMTMIALASTHDSDPRIQYAFLTFTASATFLMIHENFLRSRRGKILNASVLRDRRLFGGQVQLAAVCIVLAFLFANIVAVPIRNVGQSLGISQNIYGGNRSQPQNAAQNNRPTVISESSSLDVGGGQNENSTMIVMRVQSGRTRYWRGKTFDTYDGRAFRDTVGQSTPLIPQPMEPDNQKRHRDYMNFNKAADNASEVMLNRYAVPTSPLELAPKKMQDSTELKQMVQLEGGIFNQLYGAGNVTEIRTGIGAIEYNTAGAFQVRDTQTIQNQYTVISQIPTDNEELLRKADPDAIPDEIKRIYLQVPPMKPEDTQHLQALVAQITQGKTNAYDKMEAIREYLTKNIKYNLKVEHAPPERDAVLYLIDDIKQGYCTGFAAAMTVLCRFAHLPARLASGFLPGDLDPRTGEHTVRARDKHAWTEVYFAGIGWVTQDPTDGTEDVTPKDDDKRKGFFGWLMRQGWLAIALGAACVVLLGFVFSTELLARLRRTPNLQSSVIERHPTNKEIAALYRNTLKAFGRRGLWRPSYFTPDEFAAFVAQRTAESPALAVSLAALTGLYTRFLYGREIADASDVEQARTLSGQVRDALRQVKRK